ncbi:MAG: flagellar biosynthetic protein FliO [Deltaproteobacteria bacterium]|nr:MAG: flagellar biosynthetic protein FliO [Deltaproteobacteria bacterium]
MNAQTIEFGSAIIKMIGGLAIVLTLVFALAFLLKKLSNMSPKIGDNALLKIISTHRIGPKQVIALYQVGNKAFLLGISQDNITFLTDIAIEDLELETGSQVMDKKIPGKNFQEKLRTFMNFSIPKPKEETKA